MKLLFLSLLPLALAQCIYDPDTGTSMCLQLRRGRSLNVHPSYIEDEPNVSTSGPGKNRPSP